MTTIAYKNGIVATDSRCTHGSMIQNDNTKKVYDVSSKDYKMLGKKVLAYTIAGNLSSRLVIDELLSEGVEIGTGIDTDDDFSSIVVTQDNAYYMYKNDDGKFIQIIEIEEGNYWAQGTGKIIAEYILSEGGDPLDAVVAACKKDTGSGGDIVRWCRPEA